MLDILQPKKKYSSKDFRKTNDGVMVADIGFKKQLWALDPQLDVVWNVKAKKWEIWRFPGQEKKIHKVLDDRARHMMTVQTDKRSFRELGADILLTLQRDDPWRFSYKELCDYFDKMEDNMQRAREKHFMDHFRALYEDTYNYMKSVKKSVPFSYNLKPSEKKLLLNTKSVASKNLVIQPPKKNKMINAIAGSN